MANFYPSPLPAADTDPKQAEKLMRELIIIELAAQELRNQLSGHAEGFSRQGGPLDAEHCPTQARERNQQRLASIQAKCAAVKVLTDKI